MAGFDLDRSPTHDPAHDASAGSFATGPRIASVGGICLAAVWTVPLVRWFTGQGDALLRLLPELMFGSVSFIAVMVLWYQTANRARQHAARAADLLDQRDALRASLDETQHLLVARSKELTDEIAALHDRAERAERSNRRKSAFLASTGDEIRRSMRAVIEAADELLATAHDTRATASMGQVRDEADRLLDRIDEVLEFSAIEADRIELEDGSFELRDLVEDLIVRIAPVASARGVEVAWLVDPDLPRAVRGDGARVRQAVLGLVQHAVGRTENGTVRLRVERDTGPPGPDLVRFEVADDSAALSSERRETLFHDTGATAAGEGLALVITSHLARLMGGDVGVTSGDEAGNTTWFTMGLRSGESAHLSRVETDVIGSRAIVVSASSATRLMLVQQLREAGCVPTTASDRSSALATLRAAAAGEDPFRLVLCDAEIPGGSGTGLADTVADDELFGRPVVAVLVRAGDIETRNTVDAHAASLRLDVPMRSRELHPWLVAVLRGETVPTDETEAPVRQADPDVERIAPVVEAAARGPQVHHQPDADEAPPAGAGRRVLVVDDNPVNRRVASLTLERAGYAVDQAVDGLHALERIESEDAYDVVLMDVRMPRLDGLEATRRVRALDGPKARVPILAMTASLTSEEERSIDDAGFDASVPKPVKAAVLLDMVAEWIDRAATSPAPDDDVTLATAEFDELRAMAGDDPSILHEITASFFDTAARHLDTMRTAEADGAWDRLADAAHGLRGSAGTLGARRLHRLASSVEDTARAGGPLPDDVPIDRLAAEIEDVRGALDRVLAAPQP